MLRHLSTQNPYILTITATQDMLSTSICGTYLQENRVRSPFHEIYFSRSLLTGMQWMWTKKKIYKKNHIWKVVHIKTFRRIGIKGKQVSCLAAEQHNPKVYNECVYIILQDVHQFWKIWVRSQRFGCLVTWFCYQLIVKQLHLSGLTHINLVTLLLLDIYIDSLVIIYLVYVSVNQRAISI